MGRYVSMGEFKKLSGESAPTIKKKCLAGEYKYHKVSDDIKGSHFRIWWDEPDTVPREEYDRIVGLLAEKESIIKSAFIILKQNVG